MLTELSDSELIALYKDIDLKTKKHSFYLFQKYNLRDVEVLVKIDEKFKFIALINQMAVENTVLFENMMGTVRYVETGIANRAHRVHNLIVADKKIMTDGVKVEGALVLSPNVGLHEWIGSVDITSLYPSVIRSLNISPEKFIGQFVSGNNHEPIDHETPGEADWRGIIDGDDLNHILRTDNGEVFEGTGAEWKETLKKQKWVITAFGTVFDESSGLGIVSEALTYWFAERKALQKEKKKYDAQYREFFHANGHKATAENEEKYPHFKIEKIKTKEGTVVKLFSSDEIAHLTFLKAQVDHYDLLQLTKKITLNSAYGALLSQHFRFGRKEMGASVTACGRKITTHMLQTIGELVTGRKTKIEKTTAVEKDGSISNVYHSDNDVLLLSDTDSVDGKSIVKTNIGNMPIEELFLKGSSFSNVGEKEYSFVPNLTSLTSDGISIFEKPVLAIYRHKVSKARWKISLSNGKEVIVTGDHSIMVKRDGKLIEVKPNNVDVNIDVCVCSEIDGDISEHKITHVEQLTDFEDEYVYDIIMEDPSMPYFFANDILVHNSCYFKTLAKNKEEAIEVADGVAEAVNETFPEFMRDVFLCQPTYDNLISAGREIVGSAGLFLNAKKKYTIKVVDKEGSPVDELKTVGSEMKKADTPRVIQDFLKEMTELILDHQPYSVIEKFVNEKRKTLVLKIDNPIVLGAAKQINNLDAKYAEWKRTEKIGNGKMSHCPGHVRAAINYNELVSQFEVNGKLLKAGDKGMIFYLKPNDFQIKSIAIPSDAEEFPSWFNQHLKLDLKLSEQKMIDAKLERIFEAMQWEIPTPQNTLINSILKF